MSDLSLTFERYVLTLGRKPITNKNKGWHWFVYDLPRRNAGRFALSKKVAWERIRRKMKNVIVCLVDYVPP